MTEDEFFKTIFDNTFESTLENLQFKYETLGTSLEIIENELEHLYIYQGHCADGRSETKDLEIEATVQAYQVFLHREKNNSAGQ